MSLASPDEPSTFLLVLRKVGFEFGRRLYVASAAEVDAVKGAIRDAGAGEFSAAKARELVGEGKANADRITEDERLQTLLRALADFVISRGF